MPSSSRLKRIALIVAAIAAVVALDQLTKLWAIDTLKDEAAARVYLGNTVRVQYAENPGAFLSLMADSEPRKRFLVLTVLNTAVLGFVAVYLFAKPRLDRISTAAFTCILAGGIGNLIDRVRLDGIVVDFLNLGIGSLRTGIFNVADVAIMVGFFLLLYLFVKPPKPVGSEPVAASEQTAAASQPSASR